MQGDEIGMLDNRDGISYADTVDPKACNVNETGNWKELSRDPQRKLNELNVENRKCKFPLNM